MLPVGHLETNEVLTSRRSLISKLSELEATRSRLEALDSDAAKLLERYESRRAEQETQLHEAKERASMITKALGRVESKIGFNKKIGAKLIGEIAQVSDELEDLQRKLRESETLFDEDESDGEELEKSFYSSLLKEGIVSQTELPDTTPFSQGVSSD